MSWILTYLLVEYFKSVAAITVSPHCHCFFPFTDLLPINSSTHPHLYFLNISSCIAELISLSIHSLWRSAIRRCGRALVCHNGRRRANTRYWLTVRSGSAHALWIGMMWWIGDMSGLLFVLTRDVLLYCYWIIIEKEYPNKFNRPSSARMHRFLSFTHIHVFLVRVAMYFFALTLCFLPVVAIAAYQALQYIRVI